MDEVLLAKKKLEVFSFILFLFECCHGVAIICAFYFIYMVAGKLFHFVWTNKKNVISCGNSERQSV